MRGNYHIIVQNNRLRYEFDIRRNITIIQGDSATGKTTLIQLLELYMNLGAESGISVVCSREILVLRGRNWKTDIASASNAIIFLDEENAFVKSPEFASAVRESDCYFVIVTRENLPNLPYSVDEVYGIHSSGKYQSTRRVYNEFYRIYSSSTLSTPVSPGRIVTEDTNAGHEFFATVCSQAGIFCESAGGKSRLRACLEAEAHSDHEILAVADGAAIGPEMQELSLLMKRFPNIKCYLPESFEWMILKSGIIDRKTVSDILEHPEDFIESREYFSWERFFTHLLTEKTQGSWLQYSKHKLNPAYLQDRIRDAILAPQKGLFPTGSGNMSETEKKQKI